MSRDVRRYAQQTNFRLIVGGLLILFFIGDGLIYFIYGQGAALLGLLCMTLGLLPILLITLFFMGIEWLVKKSNPD